MARPLLNIDVEQVTKLAAINCSLAEISSVVGCSVDTLGGRFSEVIEKGRDQGKMSLKRKMWETAMGGNVTMMIWLSKQMLGYTDKIEERNRVEQSGTVTLYPAMLPEQADALLKVRLKEHEDTDGKEASKEN